MNLRRDRSFSSLEPGARTGPRCRGALLVLALALAAGGQAHADRDDDRDDRRDRRGGGWPLATGQTLCYELVEVDGELLDLETDCAGTGQDGELQLGRKLRFVDLGDGRIRDMNTGLEWEKKSDDDSIHDMDAIYTWEEAFDVHVHRLNHSCQRDETLWCTSHRDCRATVGGRCGFAGRRDWRVPNVRELFTIVDFEITDQDADPPLPRIADVFHRDCTEGTTVLTGSCIQNKQLPYTYWTSTTGDAPGDAYFVDFETADIGANGKHLALEFEVIIEVDDEGLPVFELDDQGLPVFFTETIRGHAGYVIAVRGKTPRGRRH